MNNTIAQPAVSFRSAAQQFGQTAFGPRPLILNGGAAGYGLRPASNPVSYQTVTAAPAGGGQTAAPSGGSFLDRIVGQVEQLVERVITQLVERALGSVIQKLETALGLAPAAAQAGAAQVGAAQIASADPAFAAGLVDLPPLQLTVTQSQSNTQTQNPTQSVAPPAESGGILSSIFDFFGGFGGLGEKLGSAWSGIKNIGSSFLGGAGSLFGTVGGFFGL